MKKLPDHWRAPVSMRLLSLALLTALLTSCVVAKRDPVTEIYINPESKPESQSKPATIPPVVITSGFLGSKLFDHDSGEVAWGHFLGGQQLVFRDDVQRRLALPMTGGDTLVEMRDALEPIEPMHNAVIELGSKEITVNAYPGLIHGLLIGAASDSSLEEEPSAADLRKWARSIEDEPQMSDPVRGVAFDWRRDVTEETPRLAKVIDRAYQEKLDQGYTGDSAKVDIVTHSLGALLVRYYLRYGTQALPEDGSAPVLDWRGAEKVRRAIFLGPPISGSLDSFKLLIEGGRPHPVMPKTPVQVSGSWVSLYQLMPDRNSNSVRSSEDGTEIDVYDIETWEKFGWGLLNRSPDSQQVLENLMPDLRSREARYQAARRYLEMCLEQAQQLRTALNIPSSPPPGTSMHVFASNAWGTEGIAMIDPTSGKIVEMVKVPGDGRVTRSSALGDRRLDPDPTQAIESPVDWATVHFTSGEHFGMVADPTLINNLLYLLLQAP